jgi:arylsulfatase A-like enzyme
MASLRCVLLEEMIMMRSRLRQFLWCLAGLLLAGQVMAADQTRPNILFVLVDDMGYGDLSCTGNKEVATPNIDRLAQEGMRFTKFYVAAPICSPSRVGFVTGQYPSRWRIHSYLNSRKANERRGMADFLDPKAPSLARTLKQAGYATAHFGKWHMGGGRDVDDAPLPQAYGYDESLVSFEGLGDRILPQSKLADQSAKLGHGKITRVEKHEQTGIYVDRGIDFMTRKAKETFYLEIWLNDVHDVFLPKAESLARFAGEGRHEEDRKFFATLQDMDTNLGRLFAAVDKLGLAENTLILLTSDNGPTAWPRYYNDGIEPPGSTAGFRGRKWSLYEGGIRMPLIARWKGTVPAGKVDETSVLAAYDFFPTLCHFAKTAMPSGSFDGQDISAVLLGKPFERTQPIYWRYDMDIKPGKASDVSAPLAVREGDWKLLLQPDGTAAELYDLSKDGQEASNLAAKQPDIVRRLSQQLLDWRKTLP